MKLTKAVITAASPDHRSLPIQTLVDRDGVSRSVLEILLREIHSTGIEDVCLVIHPGDEAAFRRAIADTPVRLTFIAQEERLGYGHALSLAADFIKGEPFFHAVGDHLFISSDAKRSCAQQLIELATLEDCSMSAVQSTRETEIQHYGTIAGSLERSSSGEAIYAIKDVIEKPTPTEAEQKLIVPGLRAGRYLTYFGMHVLSPLVMEILKESVRDAASSGGKVQLSPVLAELARRERYTALKVQGSRQDLSQKYGLFHAQLALALVGSESTAVMQDILEIVARSRQ
ncbi:sugar phosphate nucleotidyltransferase [Haloferula chungangensis]|uniref:UTP--glucose-1-phosphate uridylyltransferase n=1 Tax=Haloferula chungangensis TaxID=1048331 RepID=A0ABW2L7G8_9BACT